MGQQAPQARIKAVALLPRNVVKRPRTIKGLEKLMAQGDFLVVSVGKADGATVEELKRTWRQISRR